MDDVVRVYVDGVADDGFFTIYESAEFLDRAHYPASALVDVEGPVFEGLVVEIDAGAVPRTRGGR